MTVTRLSLDKAVGMNARGAAPRSRGRHLECPRRDATRRLAARRGTLLPLAPSPFAVVHALLSVARDGLLRPTLDVARPPAVCRLLKHREAHELLAAAAELGTRPEGSPVPVTVHRTRLGVALPNLDLPCLLYTSPSPRDATLSRMPSSA